MKIRYSLQDKLVFLGITLYFITCIFFSVNLEGTVDSGDSIIHYLFGRYAFVHPSNFLDHWAKPLFVILSSPFSQFGFHGIKVFNSLVSTLTLLFTYFTAKKLNKERPYLSVIFLCTAPLNIVITFSGLTEPLFALFLILFTFLYISGKEKTSLVLLSFLPFIRSEGLIIIGVCLVLLFLKRKYCLIALLTIGHLFFSIVGFFYYQDLLWVFNKIPYAKLYSYYGSGTLFHFVSQMTYVIGIPLCFLLCSGMVAIIITILKKSQRVKKSQFTEELFLVYGCFFSFFIAHSLFWYLGIFNSMGLKRVLISVIPLIAMICLNGTNFILSLLKIKKIRYIIFYLIISVVLIFPFSGNPAAVRWGREFSLTDDQKLINEMAKEIKTKYPNAVYCYYHNYISIVLDIDHFNKNSKMDFSELYDVQPIPDNILIIWDNWWAAVAIGISLESIRNDKRFKEMEVYEKDNVKFVLFIKNNH